MGLTGINVLGGTLSVCKCAESVHLRRYVGVWVNGLPDCEKAVDIPILVALALVARVLDFDA